MMLGITLDITIPKPLNTRICLGQVITSRELKYET